ncbi:DEAD/DEAH box helicase family protein [Gemella sp. GH3]|uniref:DEAD/DEAH box helicase n=1 Tax=unclassified Gemella TaxID=2624949 RepID=UPI0015D0AFB7|nr:MULTISPECIES: DEAD/DEAH box helicase [unclassified Gemella]MBF0713691.1 DEAD/DEAH box helicase family protein [Gemella sp. GH3.1]NYS50643.1 DEAD/DEAH box helicase family protein [Gemella sp. GH3]
MYYKRQSEFISSLYNVYFSNYELNIKIDLLDKIFDEYKKFGEHSEDFEEIFFNLNNSLRQNNKEITHKNNIDNKFILENNGKLLSIEYLLNKKVKIDLLNNSPHVTPVLLVAKDKNNFFCKYCGNKTQNLFFSYNNSFKKNITYCKKCATNLTNDNLTYHFSLNFPIKSCVQNLTFPNKLLSTEQKKISKQILNSTINGEKSLVWAVCGAGKTEIIYETLIHLLNKNKIVCVAIPRKDIVNELANRIKNDFNMNVNIITGDDKQFTNSNLYIMTTHQLIYYYKFFDLIIVDEVDAFPYNGNDVLEYSPLKSLKENSPLVFLSATPSKKIQKSVDNIFKLPIRYHKHLLPVPKVYKSKFKDKIVLKFIDSSLKNNRRVLIFVPKIDMLKEVVDFLKNYYNKIDCVSSIDPKRKEKISNMYTKKLDILVTTTILERGVTFDYLDVIVLEADHSHFTKEALIQISGRVGRKDYDPQGTIIFCSNKKNKAIKSAIKEIKYMNALAKHKKLCR